MSRVIPVLHFPESGVSQPVEGAGYGSPYGWTKKHPTEAGYVFPHPDLETPEVIEKWLAAWPKARFDIFGAMRRFDFPIPDFVVINDSPISTPSNDPLGDPAVGLNTSENKSDGRASLSPFLPHETKTDVGTPFEKEPVEESELQEEQKEAPAVLDEAPPVDTYGDEIRDAVKDTNPIRVKELAEKLGIESDELKTFIKSEGSGLTINNQGWVNLAEKEDK